MSANVLIVDDEPDLADLVAEFLRSAGFNTTSSDSGRRAMEILNHQPFDFVLTDIRMANGNGIELIEWISKMQQPRPVVAAISGHTESTLTELLGRGAVDLFRKPSDITSVCRAIREHLELHRTRWKDPAPSRRRGVRRYHLQSFDDSVASGELVFGHGGLFLATFDTFSPAEENDLELMFTSGPVSKLALTTRVRWMRERQCSYFHQGVGLEVIGCDQLSAGFCSNYIRALGAQAFIPIGEKPRGNAQERDATLAAIK